MSRKSNCEERLKALDQIETEVLNAMQGAGFTIAELSKDRPTMRQAEIQATSFIAGLQSVECRILREIQHLERMTSGSTHSGSPYSSRKSVDLAHHRLAHVRSKLDELAAKVRQEITQFDGVNGNESAPEGNNQ